MKKLQSFCILSLSIVIFSFAATASAQAPVGNPPTKVEITKSEKPASEVVPSPTPPAEIKVENKGEIKTANTVTTKPDAAGEKTGEEKQTSGAAGLPDDVPDDIKANRRGQLSEEEAAVVPYYNNFMTEYRLGPEDVISVEVFGQPNYSRPAITIPPNGRISYHLIKEGVFVAGKTVEQIAEEITKKLDEFIIDPKVTVYLDRAVSARYSVLGDVGTPGAHIMTRRLSVYEAIAEAGGVLSTGNKKNVILLRRGQDGRPYPIMINLKDIEAGKVKEEVFLVAGDQVIVQGNKIKVWKSLLNMLPIIGFARGIFTGGL